VVEINNSKISNNHYNNNSNNNNISFGKDHMIIEMIKWWW